MATLRVRFKLNPGRVGISLGRLSAQTENIELFLRALATDLGEEDKPNLWLAKDFKDGSFIDTNEFQAVVDADTAAHFNLAIQSLVKCKGTAKTAPPEFVSPATIGRFASLRQGLDTGEQIGVSLFDLETGKPKRWTFVDRLQLEIIGESIEAEVRYFGAVMGQTYEWIKGAKEPYLTIRELNTAELIKCVYVDADYSKVAKLFENKSAIVIIQGAAVYNRITNKTEVTRAQDFELAPDLSDGDFEKFFGCAPNLTGSLTTAEFVSRSRDDE